MEEGRRNAAKFHRHCRQAPRPAFELAVPAGGGMGVPRLPATPSAESSEGMAAPAASVGLADSFACALVFLGDSSPGGGCESVVFFLG